MGDADVLLQNIPDRLRNGIVRSVRVRYCEVNWSNVGGAPSAAALSYGVRTVDVPTNSVQLQLKSSSDYDVFVDANTTAGFNSSLVLRPLFVARHQRSNARTPFSLNSMGPTPTRTSSPISARGSSRGSRRVRRLPRSACHKPDTHDNPRRLVRRLDRHARFSSREYTRGCPLGIRACTHINV